MATAIVGKVFLITDNLYEHIVTKITLMVDFYDYMLTLVVTCIVNLDRLHIIIHQNLEFWMVVNIEFSNVFHK